MINEARQSLSLRFNDNEDFLCFLAIAWDGRYLGKRGTTLEGGSIAREKNTALFGD